MRTQIVVLLLTAATFWPHRADAQLADSLTTGYPPGACTYCTEWNEAQEPFRVFGNTYYVGTRGLSALLIASDDGHVLIDAGLPDSAPIIATNIRALGFDVADIGLLLNSHAHFDHAGGLAAFQHASGARLAASAASAPVLEAGQVGADDPQHDIHLDFPRARVTEVFSDGDTLHLGDLTLTAHLTPGHTPGGTSWSWQSCEQERCLMLVYADSQTPVSADGFRYSDSAAYPSALADFERGFEALEGMRCDVLVTPHPSASALWERRAEGPDGLIDPSACRRYAEKGRQLLQRRLQREAAQK